MDLPELLVITGRACTRILSGEFNYSHLFNKRGGWSKPGGWDFLENLKFQKDILKLSDL